MTVPIGWNWLQVTNADMPYECYEEADYTWADNNTDHRNMYDLIDFADDQGYNAITVASNMEWGDDYGTVWFKRCWPVYLDDLKHDNGTQVYVRTYGICKPLPYVEYSDGPEYWGVEYEFIDQ